MSSNFENQWMLARSSLKYFTTKFLNLQWHSHYSEWEELVTKHNRILIESPRGSRKSWFWTFAYPLWKIIRSPIEVLMVSDAEGQAEKNLRILKQAVETNPLLIPLRPSTKELWGLSQAQFQNGSLISIMGFGTSKRGEHPRLIINDDIESEQTKMSREDRNRMYWAVIAGMAVEDTQLITLGTPFEFGDLLEQAAKKTLVDGSMLYKHWKRPVYKNGVNQFPDLWSEKYIEFKRAEMGSVDFAREMLLERIDPNTQIFKRDYETLYDELPLNFSHTATVIDPAYTENDGDYTAIVTTKFTHGNHAYVSECKRFRRSDMGIIVNELFNTIGTQEPDTVGIPKRKGEALSYAFNDSRIRQNRWDFKVVELPETQGKAGKTRIGGLVPRWEARAVHIHKNMKELLEEIYQFREDDSHKNDDMLDALAHCFNPQMVSAANYKRTMSTRTEERPQPMFRVGRGASVGSPDVFAPLWKRLDRRVGDEVAA